MAINAHTSDITLERTAPEHHNHETREYKRYAASKAWYLAMAMFEGWGCGAMIHSGNADPRAKVLLTASMAFFVLSETAGLSTYFCHEKYEEPLIKTSNWLGMTAYMADGILAVPELLEKPGFAVPLLIANIGFACAARLENKTEGPQLPVQQPEAGISRARHWGRRIFVETHNFKNDPTKQGAVVNGLSIIPTIIALAQVLPGLQIAGMILTGALAVKYEWLSDGIQQKKHAHHEPR